MALRFVHFLFVSTALISFLELILSVNAFRTFRNSIVRGLWNSIEGGCGKLACSYSASFKTVQASESVDVKKRKYHQLAFTRYTHI